MRTPSVLYQCDFSQNSAAVALQRCPTVGCVHGTHQQLPWTRLRASWLTHIGSEGGDERYLDAAGSSVRLQLCARRSCRTRCRCWELVREADGDPGIGLRITAPVEPFQSELVVAGAE